ncbi:hypothetical protein FUT69_00045 [Xylella taiwanensis]|uniref:Uncharacterized protein n=1 Tax=Xylella taiwanensis TaxID=1444770 RepID=Z9JH55_9GAMM|nr:hypothetical protein [Xylella taiwanensis]AXI82812.1 hypothetical protein AB672_01990 [Xylella taiwanensis]EWS77052.1 hypothetical protein AF72_12900 [Xylella taiwanensis]MCD8455824.1 hypothetical protein [Xylella taiwanensis]MCD8458229.1 hypothetical protein [Xylella taiwanensis]MCD8460365.1 hypothetical protein [Xylella taiwanensis]
MLVILAAFPPGGATIKTLDTPPLQVKHLAESAAPKIQDSAISALQVESLLPLPADSLTLIRS